MDLSPKRLRQTILEMAYSGQTGHIGCALSIVEILSHLYSSVLKFNANDPHDPDRDYLVLSKGHGVMALYAVFREIGWVSEEDIKTYFKDGSRLHGLSESHIPGVEATTGSLGHGLPIAAGLAFGLKMSGRPHKVYCICGDGEMQEGSNWEAIQFAAQHKLSNLTLIVDSNGWQAMDRTPSVVRSHLGPRLKAFDWEVMHFDGHDMGHMAICLQHPFVSGAQPKALIGRTFKGYGVSFMKDQNEWHYKRLTDELYRQAMMEVEAS